MIRPNYKVELYKFIDEDTISTTAIDLTDALSITETAGIETRKDTFTIDFSNYKLGSVWQRGSGHTEQTDRFIRAGDNIKIYMWLGSTTPDPIDDYLIMDGDVASFTYSVDEDDITTNIKGVNRTESLLSTLVPTSNFEDGSFNTSPLIITQILNRINKFNPKKKISYALDSATNPDTGSPGNIQNTNSTGGAFPQIAYHQNYKSAYEQVEELSRPDFTGDDKVGVYVYYLKYSKALNGGYVNEFVWKSKSYTEAGSLEEGVDFGTYDLSYDVRDVVNAMIVSAGQDCYGHGKTTLVYNLESMGKYGAKWKFYPATNVIPDLIREEKSRGDTAGSTFDENFIPDVLASGSWSMAFQGRDSFGTQTGSYKVVGNDTEFNNALREEGKWLAQQEAQKIVDTLGSPTYQLTIDLNKPRFNEFVLGDLYNFILPSFNWEGNTTNPGKKLRLFQEDFRMSANGIIQQLSFKEDEKTVGVV